MEINSIAHKPIARSIRSLLSGLLAGDEEYALLQYAAAHPGVDGPGLMQVGRPACRSEGAG